MMESEYRGGLTYTPSMFPLSDWLNRPGRCLSWSTRRNSLAGNVPMESEIRRHPTYEECSSATAVVSFAWGGALFVQFLSVVALPILHEFAYGSPGFLLAAFSESAARRTVKERVLFPVFSMPYAIAYVVHAHPYVSSGVYGISLVCLLLFLSKRCRCATGITAEGERAPCDGSGE